MGDLFGEISVSLREVQLWLFKVPRLPHHATRREAYVRGWNVISKIQRAKEAGELAAIFGDESCEFCGQILCPEIISNADTRPACLAQELMLMRRRVMVLEIVLLATSMPVDEKTALVGRRLVR